jgi:hypothetical protein
MTVSYRLVSFCFLSYDRSIASSKASSPYSAIYSYYFQYHIFSLTASSSCLRLLPRLPVIYILLSVCPSIMCFVRQFLRKMWPIQLAFLLFIVCRIFLSPLTVRISVAIQYLILSNYSPLNILSIKTIYIIYTLHIRIYSVCVPDLTRCSSIRKTSPLNCVGK